MGGGGRKQRVEDDGPPACQWSLGSIVIGKVGCRSVPGERAAVRSNRGMRRLERGLSSAMAAHICFTDTKAQMAGMNVILEPQHNRPSPSFHILDSNSLRTERAETSPRLGATVRPFGAIGTAADTGRMAISIVVPSVIQKAFGRSPLLRSYS